MSIFALGGVSTMISLHSIDIAELQEKAEELEKNKASKSDLEILDDRVRRKLDGSLKSNSQKIHDLEISYYVTENDVTQTKAELKNLWQNYNRLNCK
jgi:ElaB/YqjD/DUF883 family membrane-anchored ribosome-binding protein